MPVFSTSPVRFTPNYYEDKTTAPVYLIRPGTLAQKYEYQREMTILGVRYPRDGELFDALRDGVAAVVADCDQPRIQQLLDEASAAAKSGPRDTWPEELRDAFIEVETLVDKHFQPYRELRAAREYYLNMAPLVAARMFLVGWENVSAPFKTTGGVVSDESLGAIPQADVVLIGWRAGDLMNPNGADLKNSPSPPQSGGNPPPLPEAATAPTDAAGSLTA